MLRDLEGYFTGLIHIVMALSIASNPLKFKALIPFPSSFQHIGQEVPFI